MAGCGSQNHSMPKEAMSEPISLGNAEDLSKVSKAAEAVSHKRGERSASGAPDAKFSSKSESGTEKQLRGPLVLMSSDEVEAKRKRTFDRLNLTDVNLDAAEVVIVINKAEKGKTAQTLKLYKAGKLELEARVSTGKNKSVHSPSGRVYDAVTPAGVHRVQKIDSSYRSKTWNGAKMRNSVFFFDWGTAIHATSSKFIKQIVQKAQLGTPVSGGCVRVLPKKSRRIFDYVAETKNKLVQDIFPDGSPVPDANGFPKMKTGYDTIIYVVEDQDGEEIPKSIDDEDEDSEA